MKKSIHYAKLAVVLFTTVLLTVAFMPVRKELGTCDKETLLVSHVANAGPMCYCGEEIGFINSVTCEYMDDYTGSCASISCGGGGGGIE